MTTDTSSTPASTPVPTLPGHFHFADVHTTDVDGATAFYGEMFGWQFEEVPGAPNRYLTAGIDGRGTAAITGLVDEQRAAGVPSYWFPYLWVDDIDAVVARLDGLGGELVMPAFDVFDLGRMAVAKDPTGAHFGLWQDRNPGSTIVKDEHGSPFWFELHTSDVDTAVTFYGDLVGWTTQPLEMGPDMTYHLIVPEQVDEHQQHAGGIMRMMDRHRESGAPSTWFVYFNVDDCDAAFTRAQELGAAPVMEPHDIPNAGRSCWITDPQGAMLALMKPEPPAA